MKGSVKILARRKRKSEDTIEIKSKRRTRKKKIDEITIPGDISLIVEEPNIAYNAIQTVQSEDTETIYIDSSNNIEDMQASNADIDKIFEENNDQYELINYSNDTITSVSNNIKTIDNNVLKIIDSSQPVIIDNNSDSILQDNIIEVAKQEETTKQELDKKVKSLHKIQVRKRDGRLVTFCSDKILQALRLSFQSVYQDNIDDELLTSITSKIIRQIKKQLKDIDELTVEIIQDIIEDTLLKNKEYAVAKSFIGYRAKRTQMREANNDLITLYKQIHNSNAEDMEVKRDNANSVKV